MSGEGDNATVHAQVEAFVRAMTAELSGGRVSLPGFPDIVPRIRQVLSDDNVTIEQVTRVVGAEPILTAGLLQLANSAAFSPLGKRVVDLRAAIARLGFNTVTSVSIGFAVSELRKTKTLNGIASPLAELWQRSVAVAAVSHVLARRLTKVSPDKAMLAGLLHGMGELYILTRIAGMAEAPLDRAVHDKILRGWHANAAQAVLEQWDITDDVVQSVHLQDNVGYVHEGEADLVDVLIVAKRLVLHSGKLEVVPGDAPPVSAALKLGLDARAIEQILSESAVELEALRVALGA